jgi:hypothetical protein
MMRRKLSRVLVTVATLAALSQWASVQLSADGPGSQDQQAAIVGARVLDITPNLVSPFLSMATFGLVETRQSRRSPAGRRVSGIAV